MLSPDLVELVDVFSRSELAPVLAMAGPAWPSPDPVDVSSAAEVEVVRLAARGLSYREIAAARGTSVSTVDHQLQSARHRVGARNTAQLVELADGGIAPLPNRHRWADTGVEARARPPAT